MTDESGFLPWREMKYYLENWRTYPPVKVVNETGLVPCQNCGLVIYQRRDNWKRFADDSVMDAKDFQGVNGYPDPENGRETKCPSCHYKFMDWRPIHGRD